MARNRFSLEHYVRSRFGMTVDDLLGSDIAERDGKIMGKGKKKITKSVSAYKAFKKTNGGKKAAPRFSVAVNTADGLLTVTETTGGAYNDEDFYEVQSFTKGGAEHRLQSLYAEAYAIEDGLDILNGG